MSPPQSAFHQMATPLHHSPLFSFLTHFTTHRLCITCLSCFIMCPPLPSHNLLVEYKFYNEGIFEVLFIAVSQRIPATQNVFDKYLWNITIYISIQVSESRSVVSDCLWPHGLYSPWNSPGQNTGVGSLSLLQGIFPGGWAYIHYTYIYMYIYIK